MNWYRITSGAEPPGGCNFFTTDDTAEHLSHTDIDDCIDSYLDDCEEGDEPDTVEVFGYVRNEVTRQLIRRTADAALDAAVEYLNSPENGIGNCGYDPFDDWECLPKEAQNQLRVELQSALNSVADSIKSWQCSCVVTYEVDVKAWRAL